MTQGHKASYANQLLMGWALACVAVLMQIPSARAGDDAACQRFVGTYLITIPDDAGGIDSRSLMVFSADGGFRFVDSNQGGVTGVYNPFTAAAGRWKCDPYVAWPHTASAVGLDFSLPGSVGGEQQIARLDFFGMTVDLHPGQIEGTGTLRFFPLDGDPVNSPANDAEPFSFEGVRLSAQPQIP